MRAIIVFLSSVCTLNNSIFKYVQLVLKSRITILLVISTYEYINDSEYSL